MHQRRWFEFLQAFIFKIISKPGRDNIVADTLSKKDQISTITLVSNPLIGKIKRTLAQDPYLRGIILQLPTQVTQETLGDYYFKHGLLYFKGMLCIPFNVRSQVLKEVHEDPLTAHLGYHKIFVSLRQTFFQPKMKKHALDYTKKCLVCQKIKAKIIKLPKKLHLHDIPQMKWRCVSMDFATDLLKVTGGYDSMYLVVDKLTPRYPI